MSAAVTISRIPSLFAIFIVTTIIPVFSEAGDKQGGLLSDVNSLKQSFFLLLLLLFVLLMWEMLAGKGPKKTAAPKSVHPSSRKTAKEKAKEEEDDALESLLKSARDIVSLTDEVKKTGESADKISEKFREDEEEIKTIPKPLPGFGEHPLLRDRPLVKHSFQEHHSWHIPDSDDQYDRVPSSARQEKKERLSPSEKEKVPSEKSAAGEPPFEKDMESRERPFSLPPSPAPVKKADKKREKSLSHKGRKAQERSGIPAGEPGKFKADETTQEKQLIRKPRLVSEDRIKEVEKAEMEKEEGRRRKEEERVKKIQESMENKRISALKRKVNKEIPLPLEIPGKEAGGVSGPGGPAFKAIKEKIKAPAEAASEHKKKEVPVRDYAKPDKKARDLSSTLKDIMKKKE